MAANNEFFVQVEAALLNAFPTYSSLEQMVAHQLGENLEAIAGRGDLRSVFFALVHHWAAPQGKLAQLVQAAQRENPGNAMLKALKVAEPAPAPNQEPRQETKPGAGIRRPVEGMRYLDFDLLMERSGRKCRAQVLQAPAGNAENTFQLPFDEKDLEIFRLRIGNPRSGVRRINSPEMKLAQEYGGKLFAAVFKDEVYTCFRSSHDLAQRQGMGLRLRLRVKDARLGGLPWEYLFNAQLNRFLSLGVDTPVVRYLELPQPIPALDLSLPVRVLAVIASPRDCARLDTEGEWQRLNQALGELLGRGAVLLDRLETPTLTGLNRQLARNGPYHILHFIGHGSFSEDAQDGLLLFENENGASQPVNGLRLGTILHNYPTLRLAVLNACEGGRTSNEDPFAGVAHSLLQQGIPAVVAMQFEITDQAALTFAQEFYTALAGDEPLDAALGRARAAIFAEDNDIEWGTPVLFTRQPDGRLFELADEADDPALPAYRKRLEPERKAEAEEARQRKEKEEIEARRFNGIVELSPGVTLEFVRVPAGEFLMGDDQGYGSEALAHRIHLDEYWMGKYPLTNAQYIVFMKDCGKGALYGWLDGVPPESMERHPVVNVSWHDALEFCQWASRLTGQRIRLPSEAEWEKAARGTDGRQYPWGNARPDRRHCNFNNNEKDTTPVGKYSPLGDSPSGCADMAGNVWEWTCSLYKGYPYKLDDGREDLDYRGRRTMRGGSFDSESRDVRCVTRSGYMRDDFLYELGFRVCLSLAP